jgi:murein DD-endopeptidase MepM/ murein hydrolase activator NlpD
VAGTVHWRAYQAGGAGHYVVVRGDDGRDYVFMHMLDGSVSVEKGQRVAAGQRLGLVGSTGRSDGPHLHFEIWPDGWYAEGSEPIDPLPDLQAWAAAG